MRSIVALAAIGALASMPAEAQWLKADLQQQWAGFSTALAEARPAAALGRFYTQNATVLAPGHEAVNGRAAIEKFWDETRKEGLRQITFEPQQVASTGDQAEETGRFIATFATGERDSIRIFGSYAAVWQNTWEGWRIRMEIWTANTWP